MKDMKYFGVELRLLKKGYFLEVDTIDKDDLRTAEVSFEEYKSLYRIWFNGSLIHSCKTFKSVITRLNKLDLKFPLENFGNIQ